MATQPHKDSRRMYSWWWDSHISPKNSKWLQENLTGMDAKVKAMIKLIEEDADSFARRAEMYYKKRPELMKLVEEFYRAYRALAERYDNATSVLRQAHRTMAEAFPNQVPMAFADDSPAGSFPETDPQTPETPRPVRGLFDRDNPPKDGPSFSPFYAAKRNDGYSEEFDSVTSRKGIKQFNDLFGSGERGKLDDGKVRKGLNFNEAEDQVLSSSEELSKLEKEIQTLKEALAKLEAEKETGQAQYQQSLERFSKLESEFSQAQEDLRGLNERASRAEGEVEVLKESLTKLQAEKEASLLQYQQCLERIAILESSISRANEEAGELNELASRAETEVQALKQDLASVESEKNVALDQYRDSLEKISVLEDKLSLSEEDARKLKERAEKAEGEVESLKRALAKLTEEKEAAALNYQQCLETISSLELKISSAKEEIKKLSSEIDNGVQRLKGAEEKCLLLEQSNQSLHSEVESMVLKMGAQSQELTEKQKELGRLWTSVQEERMRFVEAETAFQTLQHLHSKTQEEMRHVALELQNKVKLLGDFETQNKNLQDEVQKISEENKSLNEINLSSAMSINDMQDEMFGLRETKTKLEGEVELRVDQRNALQQEIYCLKEELNVFNHKHQAILDQIDAVGFKPECLESSLRELQDENLGLKENCQRETSEKVALLEKLEILEKLMEKNALLENSLSELSTELKGARANIKALEESIRSLLEEKSALVDEKATLTTQLQVTTENLEKLSEKNTFLENSLSDAQDELEGLKERLKRLEDSCQLLETEKSELINEKGTLSSQVEITQQRLQDLQKLYAELEEKCHALKKEKLVTLSNVKELQVSLDAEKQEHSLLTKISEAKFATMQSQISLLQEESCQKRRELDAELDKSIDSQVKIFIWKNCARDLEEKNRYLLTECQKLLEASKSSEKLISKLELQNLEQQAEAKSFLEQLKMFRLGLYQLLKVLEIDMGHECEEKTGQDQSYLNQVLSKLQDIKLDLYAAHDDNQTLAVEISVLVTVLGQLSLELKILEKERWALHQELRNRTEQLSALQIEARELLQMNEELHLQLSERDQKEEALMVQIENLQGKLLDMQQVYQNLQLENSKVLEEKKLLSTEFLDLEERNRNLEEQNLFVFAETLSLSNLSLVFKNFIDEKVVELKMLGEDLDDLHAVNCALDDKLRMMEGKLAETEVDHLHLKWTLKKTKDELRTVKSVNDQLGCAITEGKDLLSQKQMELSEAEHKLTVFENEKSELQKSIEDLKEENDGIKMAMEDQKNQILKLSEENNDMRKENGCLREVNVKLEADLCQLGDEYERSKRREESLCSELKNSRSENELWETEATTFYGELQISGISQTLMEEKVHELDGACKSLEHEIVSKNTDIEHLEERISCLEGENGGLKAQFAAYIPALISLKECVSSLENHTHFRTKDQDTVNQKEKEIEPVSNHVRSSDEVSEVQRKLDALSELQDLQTRVEAIEQAVIKMESAAIQRSTDANTKLEAATRQIEELTSKSGSNKPNRKPSSEISESENGLLTKDIMLDHIYGMSKKENVNTDNEVLESRNSADGSIDPTVCETKAVKKKNQDPNSEIMVEKELGVDKQAISKRFSGSRQEMGKRRILERLDSDVQKLMNLQITVQDLKMKMMITEKSRKGKSIIEWDTLKEQLEESEAAIQQLFDQNGRLMKNVEDKSLPSVGKPMSDFDESGDVRRTRVSEQARRLSEKIGRLQLEVQKIQFVLLKLDDRKESKGKNRIAEMKRRVLLRDYLDGGGRTNQRKKKAAFCACVQPPTTGD